MRTITSFELAEERLAITGRFSVAHREAVVRAFEQARSKGLKYNFPAEPPAVMPTYLTVNTPPWGCALLAEKSRDGRTAYRLESRSDASSGRRYLRLRSASA